MVVLQENTPEQSRAPADESDAGAGVLLSIHTIDHTLAFAGEESQHHDDMTVLEEEWVPGSRRKSKARSRRKSKSSAAIDSGSFSDLCCSTAYSVLTRRGTFESPQAP